ncbi:hypothetical protein BDZ94DRAFT_1249630, partial [Collybia nuda]
MLSVVLYQRLGRLWGRCQRHALPMLFPFSTTPPPTYTIPHPPSFHLHTSPPAAFRSQVYYIVLVYQSSVCTCGRYVRFLCAQEAFQPRGEAHPRTLTSPCSAISTLALGRYSG